MGRLGQLFAGLVVGSLLLSTQVHAQLWSGVLDTHRATDWSQAGRYGGVPTGQTTCTTLGTAGQVPTYAQSVTAAQLETALNTTCAGTNQVVMLETGTYTFASTINITSGGVVLRGEGATNTLLVFTGTDSCGDGLTFPGVCISDSGMWNGGVSNLRTFSGASIGGTPTAGVYTEGATVITVSSATSISAGMWLILDQNADTTDGGGVHICNYQGAACSAEGPGSSAGRCDTGGCSGSDGDHPYTQFVRVMSVSGNNLTINPPLIGNFWASGKSPSFWFTTAQTRNVGIENLTIDARGSGGSVLTISNGFDNWIKGIRALKESGAVRNAIRFNFSGGNTLRDSYVQGATGQATNYSVETWISGSNLVENNIFFQGNSPFLENGASWGNVFAYNFAVDQTSNSADWLYPATMAHATTGMTLIEGNDVWSLMQDHIHGSHGFYTYFRNRSRGSDNTQTTYGVHTQQTVPILMTGVSRFANVVGNVLGRGGLHTVYARVTGGATTSCDQSIYNIGFGGTQCNDDPYLINVNTNPDTKSLNSLMRWGNYDVVTGTVRWCGNSGSTGWSTTCSSTSEVPTGDAHYPVSVPASETLPDSFYLAAQPTAWWGTPWGDPAWPPIGPDVTGGDISEGTGGEAGLDGHAYKIPARLCFENTTQTSGVLNFDASTCYQAVSGDTTPPAVPTGITIVRRPD